MKEILRSSRQGKHDLAVVKEIPLSTSFTPYKVKPDGIVRIVLTEKGSEERRLTNFVARIVAEIDVDDGVSTTREFELQIELGNETHTITVPARDFPKMDWVLSKVGGKAIIEASPGNRDHTRAAIQHLSGEIEKRRVYIHTGWVKIAGDACFLHGDGGINAHGEAAGVEVRLPDPLHGYRLPSPPPPNLRRILTKKALEALLKLADLETITVVFATVFRAPLGQVGFSVHFEGRTGLGKSELVAIAAQFFGRSMDARNLPGNWSSTPNANEVIGFHAKDVVLVIDDFIPTGSTLDAQSQHRDADRLLRGQGNGSGRHRLNSDSTLQPAKYPRGLILSTGEDSPNGHSLRARMLIVEVTPQTVNWAALTECQKLGRNGVLARVMTAYIQFIASQFEQLPARVAELKNQLRDAARIGGAHAHPRTPDVVADLGVGLHYFLTFALSVKAINEAEYEELWQSGWDALIQAGRSQATAQTNSDPAARFLELLASGLSSGHAHLAGEDGHEPENPSSYGWREFTVGTGENERTEWRGQGIRVGWVIDDDVYLDPNAAFKLVQSFARDSTAPFAMNIRTLQKRLHEGGLLATVGTAGQTNTTRKMLEGKRRSILHLKVATLFPEDK